MKGNEIEENNFRLKVEDTKKFPTDTIYIQNPLYILIELLEPKLLPQMNNLPERFVPIIALDSQNFNIDFDLSKILPLKKFKKIPNIKVSRKQFTLAPAYAFTSHRSQGITIPKVILDLTFPPPPIAIEPALTYVPLTRVKKMTDLAFLREFPLSSLQIKPSKDQKSELLRLESLNIKTKDKFEKQYSINSKCN